MEMGGDKTDHVIQVHENREAEDVHSESLQTLLSQLKTEAEWVFIQHFYNFTVKISEYVSSVWTVVGGNVRIKCDSFVATKSWLTLKKKKSGQVKNWLVLLRHRVTQSAQSYCETVKHIISSLKWKAFIVK